MLIYKGVDQFAVRNKRAMSRLFVLPHEAAVAEHVGAEYGRQLTFHTKPPLASSCPMLVAVNATPGPSASTCRIVDRAELVHALGMKLNRGRRMIRFGGTDSRTSSGLTYPTLPLSA